MTKRFKDASDALIKAFINEELNAGDCNSCAVGSICAKASIELDIPLHTWGHVFLTDIKGIQHFYNSLSKFHEIGVQLIEATGYTVKELAQIEYLFETTTKIKTRTSAYTPEEIANDRYHALVAVIELLMSFDAIEDTSALKALKAHPLVNA